LRSVVEALGIEGENARAGGVDVGKHGREILRKAAGRVLQQVLDRGEVAGESRRKFAAVNGKSAIVVEIHADAGKIYNAAVAADGVREGPQELALDFAQGVVGFKRAATAAVGGDFELRIDLGDHGVVSYADFITLLFAFFVVLYASSQVDKRKVGRLAMAIQVAFQELGVFDTSNTHIPLSDMEAIPFANVQAVENVERTSDMERIVQPMKGILAPASAPLKDIQAELEKALAPEIKRHVVDIKSKKEGLVVSLREMGFYESGASSMRASSVEAVDRLADVIIPRTENLRIEGYTDNIPIHNAHFPSNWELSTARAIDFVRMFIDRYHVEPNRLSAAGFAEYHPVDDNATSEGRARNRRIDIVILNPAFQEKSPFATPAAAPVAWRQSTGPPPSIAATAASPIPARQ
jgi:chemotaxis protein MotB